MKSLLSISNKSKSLIISFLMMAYVGASWGCYMICTNYIAKQLTISPEIIIASLVIFTTAVVIMEFASTGFFLDFLSLKTLIFISCILQIAGTFIILITTNVLLFKLSLLLFGLGYGTSYVLAFYIITLITTSEERSSVMTFTALFFSIGTMVAPFLGGIALQYNVNWKIVFYSPAILLICIIFLLFSTQFYVKTTKNIKVEKTSWKKEISEWPKTVFLIAGALFFYTAVETLLSASLVIYGENILKLEIFWAGLMLSIFWAAVAVGRLLFSIVLRYIKVETYIIFASSLGGILILFLQVFNTNIIIINIFIFFTGLMMSALYASLTSLGTIQQKKSSSKMFSLFIGCGGCGLIAAPIIIDILSNIGNMSLLFSISAVLLFIVAGFTIIVKLLDAVKGYSPYDR